MVMINRQLARKLRQQERRRNAESFLSGLRRKGILFSVVDEIEREEILERAHGKHLATGSAYVERSFCSVQELADWIGVRAGQRGELALTRQRYDQYPMVLLQCCDEGVISALFDLHKEFYMFFLASGSCADIEQIEEDGRLTFAVEEGLSSWSSEPFL